MMEGSGFINQRFDDKGNRTGRFCVGCSYAYFLEYVRGLTNANKMHDFEYRIESPTRAGHYTLITFYPHGIPEELQ